MCADLQRVFAAIHEYRENPDDPSAQAECLCYARRLNHEGRWYAALLIEEAEWGAAILAAQPEIDWCERLYALPDNRGPIFPPFDEEAYQTLLFLRMEAGIAALGAAQAEIDWLNDHVGRAVIG